MNDGTGSGVWSLKVDRTVLVGSEMPASDNQRAGKDLDYICMRSMD